jgi:hypothetical protein
MTDEHEVPAVRADPAAGTHRAAPAAFGVRRIALRQLRARPALTVAQGLTLVAATTLLASVALIQGTATTNGLRSALSQGAASQGSNLVIERDGISAASGFDAFQREASARVSAQLGPAVVAGARIGKSPVQVLRSIDGAVQGQPFSNLSSVSFYAGLRDHVRLVAGQWPGDTRAGADWSLTASARATDTLGTPLGLKVGNEYCFGARLSRGSISTPWCGRLAATWVPLDATDAYWAGHVPDTDVLTEHDSFFQIVNNAPGALNSAIQQYVPNPGRISGTNAGSIVHGVGQLRGFYSVSSNDVFVSGLDTTITTFQARQDAASGPMLVTAIGLLVVALAAMAFAALQFIHGHVAEVALWRARGWSRRRVWALHTSEFAVLALAAIPLAILASAAISAAVAGSATNHFPFSAQSIADASIPSVVAAAVFVVVLSGLAIVRSGPELSQRPSDRPATQRRSWRRRAVDLVLAAAGAAILLLVRFAGADTVGSGQSSGVVLALPVLAVGLLASASLRLVGVASRILTIRRTLAARLARWQLERDPAQYARLCLLVTLAVTVGVFASTYTASDRASAIDRADYTVGADLRATFSSAASPPQLTALSTSLPAGVRAAQVFRGVGRPGRTGTDATVIGIQGTDFWNIAYSGGDFATPSLPTLTSALAASDPDGSVVPGAPRALSLTVYSSGFDARLDVEVTDSNGSDVVLPMGTLRTAGWNELSASLSDVGQQLAYPVRVRALRVTPHGSNGVGDVAVENLRTDNGAVVESFAAGHGWWQEAFAPDTAEASLKATRTHTRHGEPSVDVAVDLQTVLILPPPSSRPLPVLLAAPTMAALGVSVGQAFPVHMDTVDVQLVPVGTFDDFPTHYPQKEDLLVAPMSSLLSRLGFQGATSPWPNELWLKVPSSAAGAVNTRVSADPTLLSALLRSDAESTALNDPLRVGIHDELVVGFVVALAVVIVGFGLHFLAAARNRATQFAIMRANGVPQSALRRSLVAEQVVVLLSGLIAGTGIGLALSWAVTPIFHLGALPEDVTPASVFSVDPLTLVAVVIGTAAVALVMGRLVAGSGSRVDVMTTVRSLA